MSEKFAPRLEPYLKEQKGAPLQTREKRAEGFARFALLCQVCQKLPGVDMRYVGTSCWAAHVW